MPRLSFILPVYRPRLDVFEKCVKSLRDQALKEWEAIFVLDGQCQEARDVVRKAGDQRMRVVEITHGGAPAARNEGAKHASGDFWCFFDSDCILEPGASKMWVEVFDKKPHVGFIYSGYKFFGEQYGITSEPWDPFTLKVRNYISSCFPLRRELYPGWSEDLESLQDWDFWLSVVEKAKSLKMDVSKVGLFVKGYAFSTAPSTPESISGKGCSNEVWLSRMDAVKKKHSIKDLDICVTSAQYRHDGIRLAKLLGADYQDFPNDKPNKYKTFIQVGFSLLPQYAERCAAVFQGKDSRKVLFWTGDDINTIWNAISFKAVDTYASLLNGQVLQYVEDLQAKKLMTRAGFEVQVMPMPFVSTEEPAPLPENPKFCVDIAGDYGPAMAAVERSLPDIELSILTGEHSVSEYTGMIHFYPDRSLSNGVKRAVMAGRHVISNIQQPFCGFVNDKDSQEVFITGVAHGVRSAAHKGPSASARDYYTRQLSPNRLLEILK